MDEICENCTAKVEKDWSCSVCGHLNGEYPCGCWDCQTKYEDEQWERVLSIDTKEKWLDYIATIKEEFK